VIEGPVVVSRKGQDRIERGHPWIFRSDVERESGISPGALVRVESRRGQALGHALYSSRSEIRLRMVERGETISSRFLEERLETAVAWRREAAEGAEACRLVHAEGDRLPSLVVDRYGEHLVLQTLSQGMEARKGEIVSALQALLQPRGIVERNDPRVRLLEGLEQQVSVLAGEVPDRVEVREGEVRLGVDLRGGQKTGLFLDQRENHRAARRYARGRVLDAFCYDGGFALQVAGRADEVTAVDLSEDALARLEATAAANGIANVRTRNANVFDLLRALDEGGERFDMVVLDPPAFAKSKGAVEKAWRGYAEINRRALRVLRPGGTLVTCSCSHHIHEDDFEAILVEAAADAGATVSIVERRGQARDHPVLLGVPETSYLKCFVLRRLS
jgi:23S rRNA (cytosine1962-C5)-methyltransferase